ncbi:MAG: 1-(5-phosphoribosyl)-5-[(5-phosphoribosylamino)methylideneamino]imidazole-4-carboxamide isomerase [Opitutales bacterium]|nr:1-(5-phosphoribosyl)-5-[(5-phosphoribosylamino)methylideneamino]imidazole-4-carboxamide isomerase [Opitutales bacterium]
MRIFPAIDIKDGRCVRLLQGKADQETVYHNDPLEPARLFAIGGAEWVHVVDLDGAFSGEPKNLEFIIEIAKLGLKVQMGGGLREIKTIEKVLEAGISRAVIGTRACDDPDFAEEVANEFGNKIAVGIDAKNGKVAVNGWTKGTDREVLVLARMLEDAGVQTLIHTDIATDGMMKGPNIAAQRALLERVTTDVIASGGVSKKEDIGELNKLADQYPHLKGVIVGKALYEGTVKLEDF